MDITPETLSRWLALVSEIRCRVGPSEDARVALGVELHTAYRDAITAPVRAGKTSELGAWDARAHQYSPGNRCDTSPAGGSAEPAAICVTCGGTGFVVLYGPLGDVDDRYPCDACAPTLNSIQSQTGDAW